MKTYVQHGVVNGSNTRSDVLLLRRTGNRRALLYKEHFVFRVFNRTGGELGLSRSDILDNDLRSCIGDARQSFILGRFRFDLGILCCGRFLLLPVRSIVSGEA